MVVTRKTAGHRSKQRKEKEKRRSKKAGTHQETKKGALFEKEAGYEDDGGASSGEGWRKMVLLKSSENSTTEFWALVFPTKSSQGDSNEQKCGKDGGFRFL